MSIVDLEDVNLTASQHHMVDPPLKPQLPGAPAAARDRAFTIQDARMCERKSPDTFRDDLDFATQQQLVVEARARRKYTALLEDYQRSCADAQTHRIFLQLLVAEGRRYQVQHYRTFKLSKPRLSGELHQKLDEVFKQEMQVHDGYVELLGDVATMRLFDLRPRTARPTSRLPLGSYK